MHIFWPGHGPTLDIVAGDEGPPRVLGLAGPSGATTSERIAPALVEVMLAAQGRTGDTGGVPSRRHVGTVPGARLRYREHHEDREGDRRTLRVVSRDPVTGLTVASRFEQHGDLPVLRCWTEVVNGGDEPVTLEFVSSFTATGFTGAGADWAGDLRLAIAYNAWCGEVRWREHTLPDLGLDEVGSPGCPENSRRRVAVTSTGSWSTNEYLPMGALRNIVTGRTWLWQIEHNGSWHWEVSDRHGDLDLVVSGPADPEHQWRRRLHPGDGFTSVPVAVAVVDGDLTDAVRAMTAYRRAVRRPHPDNATLPVIFNDYMNCLEGDPTTGKILPLVEAAAAVGAEYFCIDAGWYADDTNWWDGVGAWQESRQRFPDGLSPVLDRIRDAGMVPGLWVEPEVIGVRSPLAGDLPEEAFFRRNGARVAESGRHHLDFRHPAAVAHLDAVVDRLVGGYGVGYLKFDYNIEAGPGTEVDADSPGDGLLGHNRALLAWLERVLDRHPDLVIENCGSGGMRMDHAMLSRLPVQSLTDQPDHRRLAAIAAAAPTAVPPEQAASWVYPQPEFDDETIAFNLVNGMLGRIHLSGRIDRMSPPQRALVAAGLDAYKALRAQLPTARPFWPLGLPGWTDPWLALGMDGAPGHHLLAVWRRGGDDGCVLPVPALAGGEATVECLYPAGLPGSYTWDASAGAVRVDLPAPVCARLLRLTPQAPR